MTMCIHGPTKEWLYFSHVFAGSSDHPWQVRKSGGLLPRLIRNDKMIAATRDAPRDPKVGLEENPMVAVFWPFCCPKLAAFGW